MSSFNNQVIGNYSPEVPAVRRLHFSHFLELRRKMASNRRNEVNGATNARVTDFIVMNWVVSRTQRGRCCRQPLGSRVKVVVRSIPKASRYGQLLHLRDPGTDAQQHSLSFRCEGDCMRAVVEEVIHALSRTLYCEMGRLGLVSIRQWLVCWPSQ